MSKYHLTEIIHSLNKEEIRNFKLFSARLQSGNERNKTVALFDSIKTENLDEFSEEITLRFFPDNNKNAYYRLKNRLLADIEQSLLLLHHDKDEKYIIYNLIEIANIFKYKSKYELAHRYLLKAEKEAQHSDYADLLDVVYGEIIALTNDYYKINPEIYIQKRQKNLESQMATQQAQYLIATLNYRLKSTNFAFREDDLRSLLDQILAALAIDKSVALSPTVQFQIHESIRTDLLQRKNFVALEAYLIESLQQFQQKKLFSEKFYEKIFVLLNWIINASAINFNFEQSLHYTHLLHEELQKQNRKYYPKYVWVYHQSLVFNYSLLNRNTDVIQLLNDIHKDPSLTGHSFYDVLSHLNLAVAYYNQNDLNNALKSLLPLLTSDAYNNLSPTMQLILGVVELILHCENKDFLYVESKIAELKRQFRSELNSKQYEREQSFLAILKMIAHEAVPFQSKKTIEKCQEFIDKSPPFEPGSNEAINYKLWLQSKLTKQSYYQLVLKAVRR